MTPRRARRHRRRLRAHVGRATGIRAWPRSRWATPTASRASVGARPRSWSADAGRPWRERCRWTRSWSTWGTRMSPRRDGDPLLGDDGPSVREWAEWAGSIEHEIVTGLGARWTRVYRGGRRSESDGHRRRCPARARRCLRSAAAVAGALADAARRGRPRDRPRQDVVARRRAAERRRRRRRAAGCRRRLPALHGAGGEDGAIQGFPPPSASATSAAASRRARWSAQGPHEAGPHRAWDRRRRGHGRHRSGIRAGGARAPGRP